ncbi:MAG: RcnB family protein [Caulobacterales bacterium]
MKKLLFATAAGFALIGPLAVPASAQEHDRRGEQSERRGQGREQQNSHSDQYRQFNDNDRADEARRSDRRDRRDRRQSWRDSRHEARWDDTQHNGYYRGNRWHFGPPPASLHSRVTLGYRPWARGQRLGYYNNRYTEVDYRQQNLRPPPRGYHYVRDNDGDIILAAIVSGLIASVIINNSR